MFCNCQVEANRKQMQEKRKKLDKKQREEAKKKAAKGMKESRGHKYGKEKLAIQVPCCDIEEDTLPEGVVDFKNDLKKGTYCDDCYAFRWTLNKWHICAVFCVEIYYV